MKENYDRTLLDIQRDCDALDSQELMKDLLQQVKEVIPSAKFRPCSKVIREHEIVFTCQTCSQPNTLYCAECYKKVHEQHKGHYVSCLTGHDGICDCGDTDTFLPEICCHKHQINHMEGWTEMKEPKNFYLYSGLSLDAFALCWCFALELFKRYKVGYGDPLVEGAVQDPYISRVMSIALFFSNQSAITLRQMHQLYGDFEGMGKLEIERGDVECYFVQFVQNERASEQFAENIRKDFVHKWLFDRFINQLISEGEKVSFDNYFTCNGIIESVTNPYCQLGMKSSGFFHNYFSQIEKVLRKWDDETFNNYTDLSDTHGTLLLANCMVAKSFRESPQQDEQLECAMRIWKNIQQKSTIDFGKKSRAWHQIMDNQSCAREYAADFLTFVLRLTIELREFPDERELIRKALDIAFNSEIQEFYGTEISFAEFLERYPQLFKNALTLIKFQLSVPHLTGLQITTQPMCLAQVYCARLVQFFKLDVNAFLSEAIRQLGLQTTASELAKYLVHDLVHCQAVKALLHSGECFKAEIVDIEDLFGDLDDDAANLQLLNWHIFSLRHLLAAVPDFVQYVQGICCQCFAALPSVSQKLLSHSWAALMHILARVCFMPVMTNQTLFMRCQHSVENFKENPMESELLDMYRENFQMPMKIVTSTLHDVVRHEMDENGVWKATLLNYDYLEPELIFNMDLDLPAMIEVAGTHGMRRVVDSSLICPKELRAILLSPLNASFRRTVIRAWNQQGNDASVSTLLRVFRLVLCFGEQQELQVHPNKCVQRLLDQVRPSEQPTPTARINMREKMRNLKAKQESKESSSQVLMASDASAPREEDSDLPAQVECIVCHEKIEGFANNLASCICGVGRTCVHSYHRECVEKTKLCSICGFRSVFPMSEGQTMEVIKQKTIEVLKQLLSDKHITEAHKKKFGGHFFEECRIIVKQDTSAEAQELTQLSFADYYEKYASQTTAALCIDAFPENLFDVYFESRCSACNEWISEKQEPVVNIYTGQRYHTQCLSAAIKQIEDAGRVPRIFCPDKNIIINAYDGRNYILYAPYLNTLGGLILTQYGCIKQRSAELFSFITCCCILNEDIVNSLLVEKVHDLFIRSQSLEQALLQEHDEGAEEYADEEEEESSDGTPDDE